MAVALEDPLTQEQWYDKLESWIPTWYFLTEDNQVAHLQALAFILSYHDGQVHEHVRQTFITYAEDEVLNEFARNRGIERLPGELDAQFRIRIRNISNDSDCPTLKSLIDSILMAGEATIIEDFESQLFLNREQFYSRDSILVEQIENVFTILVDKQLHEPYSFHSREYFMDRDYFIGTGLSSDYVFNLIQAIVDENKATGTLYRVIERLES
jgi:hypothetical protein